MPADKAIINIEVLASVFKNAVLVISGGEPGLHNDFPMILENSAQSFPRVIMTTNGTFNDYTYKTIYSYKKQLTVQVSLDGTREVHDAIRGNGVFNEAVDNIKKLVNDGFKVTVSSTVHSENMQSMFELADIISKLNIHHWNISQEQAFDNFALGRMPDVSVWNSFVDNIIKQARCRIRIRKLFDFSLFEKAEQKYGKEALEQSAIPNCGIGRTKIYIYPDFSVVPCTCMPDIVIGNLLNDSVEEIKDRLGAFKCNIETASPCYSCRWNYLCKGGCPGYSYHMYGKTGYGDIRCPLTKKNA
jgi:radical SAM protein with 4Fe4S-binding SPASM domain